MPCYRPLPGLDTRTVRPDTQKRIIKILPREAWFTIRRGELKKNNYLSIPCGQCIGCRLERSRQWAVRCMHEASLHKDNCFITLTYNEENLPPGRTLHKPDFQKFMKRFRKAFPNETIRYYMCGEYGEQFSRPHYHACIFGFNFADKKFWKTTGCGEKLYVSQTLEKLWTNPETKKPIGYCSIGNVTFESAAYVARYILKKQNGEAGKEHYTEIDYSTGEILSERTPEYNTMSRRPGIAAGWLEKYMSDVYPDDFVLIRKGAHTKGESIVRAKPPKYYDSKYELTDPESYVVLKEKRKINAKRHEKNNTFDRLSVREEIQLIKAKQLIRSYEK